jgi:hypothetical protein
MHHVWQIKDLKGNLKLDWFTAQMAVINSKQIPLCRKQHMDLHCNRLSSEVRPLYLIGLENVT